MPDICAYLVTSNQDWLSYGFLQEKSMQQSSRKIIILAAENKQLSLFNKWINNVLW